MLFELWETHRGQKTLKMRDVRRNVGKCLKALRQSHRGDSGYNWNINTTDNNEKVHYKNQDRSH